MLLFEYNNLKKEVFTCFIMKKCYLCGASEEGAFLYEGVSKEGFVHVCRKCYLRNEIPLVETKNLEKGFEKKMSVRERLMNLSGMKRPKEDKSSIEKLGEAEEVTLKDLIEKNFKKDLPKDKKEYLDLIENFHWVIMRKRRMQKLTQEQFAKKIFEPLIVVEHLEKGILPKNYYNLIKKVESALGIGFFKEQSLTRLDSNSLVSESKVSTGITISDLKGLHEEKVGQPEIDPEELSLEKVEELVGKPVEDESRVKRNWFGRKKKTKEEDVSQEEIDDIMFRRGD